MKEVLNQKKWVDPSRYLKKIYVERSCQNNAYVEEILARAELPFEYLDEAAYQTMVEGGYPENLSMGKSILLLSKNKGTFIRDCPSTRVYQCCGYRVINSGTGCPMDCTYCILQAYLNNPYQNFYINMADLFKELDTIRANDDKRVLRIGTGEFSDSMALDRITGLSRKLIRYFKDKSNCVLELKTKSAWTDNVANIDHGGRTIMAWSLNSDEIVAREEFRTASIDERLGAAALCSSLGYRLAFHFDPIIAYPGWQEGYRMTIEKLFNQIPAASICWISLGGFRYVPKLKKIGTSRFPTTTIYYHEFIEGLDSKQRYFRPLRVHLYKHIYSLLRAYADPKTCIYFCMESNEIWHEVAGFVPEDYGGLSQMLDDSVSHLEL